MRTLGHPLRLGWHLGITAVLALAPTVIMLRRPAWSLSRGEFAPVAGLAAAYLLSALVLTWLRTHRTLRWAEVAGVTLSVFAGFFLLVLIVLLPYGRGALLFGIALASLFLVLFVGPRTNRAPLVATLTI